MPAKPIPEAIEAFLREPNHAVIAVIRADGRPICVPTWYEYTNDGSILVNMDEGRARLRHIRKNPSVAMSIMDHENWIHHISLTGTVREIYDDEGMRDIDRLAMQYMNIQYKNRERGRVSALINIDTWFGWDARTFKENGVADRIKVN